MTRLTRRQLYQRRSGLTQRQLAQVLGLSVGQVNGLLQGHKGRAPRPRTRQAMRRMAALLGVSAQALWGPQSLRPIRWTEYP